MSEYTIEAQSFRTFLRKDGKAVFTNELLTDIQKLQSQLEDKTEGYWSMRRECIELKALSAKQDEYLKIICEELNETTSIASVHGWKSTRYKEGMKLREEMNLLRNPPVLPSGSLEPKIKG